MSSSSVGGGALAGNRASLRISIHRAADLIPADSNGLADPYLVLYHVKASQVCAAMSSPRGLAAVAAASAPAMATEPLQLAVQPEAKPSHRRSASASSEASPKPKRGLAEAPPQQQLVRSGSTLDGKKKADDESALLSLLDPAQRAAVEQALPSSKQKKCWQLVCKTATMFKTLSPAWEVVTYIPAVEPGDVLYMEVIDYDRFSRDDFQGNAALVLGAEASSAQPAAAVAAASVWGQNVEDLEVKLRPQGSVFLSLYYGPSYEAKASGTSAKKATAKIGSTVHVFAPPSLASSSSSAAVLSSASVSAMGALDSMSAHDRSAMREAMMTSLAGSTGELFSVTLTVHHGVDLPADVDTFLVLSLVTPSSSSSSSSSSSAKATLVKPVSRSSIRRGGTAEAARWDITVVFPNFNPAHQVLLRVMAWREGARDRCLGERQLNFAYPMTARDNLRLDLQGSKRGGGVVVSYATAAAKPGLGTTTTDPLGRRDLVDPVRLGIEHMELHGQNYGVKVPNFRDVGGWSCRWRDARSGLNFTGRMKTRMVLRSSAIHRATQADARIITEELGVRTFFDLRTPDYAGNRGPFLTPLFKVKELRTAGSDSGAALWQTSKQDIVVDRLDFENVQRTSMLDQRTRLLEASTTQSFLDEIPFDFRLEDACMPGSGQTFGTLYLQGLVGAQFKKAMIMKTKPRTLLKVVGKEPQEQRRMICGPIFDPSDGVSVLYTMLIEECQSEFLLLLKSFIDPAVAVYPLAYFCNHGKDRTGLTTMFLQAVCGVDRQTIVYNYALSEYFLTPIQDIVDAEMVDGGLTPDVMSRTPIAAMVNTLDLLDQKYGGVLDYLTYIGFGPDMQQQLRDKLVDVDKAWERRLLRFRVRELRERTWGELHVTVHRGVGVNNPANAKATEFYVRVRQSSSLTDDPLARSPRDVGVTPKCSSPDYHPVFDAALPVADVDGATRLIFLLATGDGQEFGQCVLDVDELGPALTGEKLSLIVKPLKPGGRRVTGHLVVSLGAPTSPSSSLSVDSLQPLGSWLSENVVRGFEEQLIDQGVASSAQLLAAPPDQLEQLAAQLSERFLAAVRHGHDTAAAAAAPRSQLSRVSGISLLSILPVQCSGALSVYSPLPSPSRSAMRSSSTSTGLQPDGVAATPSPSKRKHLRRNSSTSTMLNVSDSDSD